MAILNWRLITSILFAAFTLIHADHHGHNQETFSASRLNELGEKWGIDVRLPR